MTDGVPWAVAPQVLSSVEAHAREARPRECCGLLLGTPGHVAEVRRTPNLAADPNRFEIDPGAHVAAIRETRGTGVEVVGFYHSHPHSVAVPSERDVAESTYPEALHMIVGFPGDRVEIRCFLLRDGAYQEVGWRPAPALQ